MIGIRQTGIRLEMKKKSEIPQLHMDDYVWFHMHI